MGASEWVSHDGGTLQTTGSCAEYHASSGMENEYLTHVGGGKGAFLVAARGQGEPQLMHDVQMPLVRGEVIRG